jgi:hypothetical protein
MRKSGSIKVRPGTRCDYLSYRCMNNADRKSNVGAMQLHRNKFLLHRETSRFKYRFVCSRLYFCRTCIFCRVIMTTETWENLFHETHMIRWQALVKINERIFTRWRAVSQNRKITYCVCSISGSFLVSECVLRWDFLITAQTRVSCFTWRVLNAYQQLL